MLLLRLMLLLLLLRLMLLRLMLLRLILLLLRLPRRRGILLGVSYCRSVSLGPEPTDLSQTNLGLRHPAELRGTVNNQQVRRRGQDWQRRTRIEVLLLLMTRHCHDAKPTRGLSRKHCKTRRDGTLSGVAEAPTIRAKAETPQFIGTSTKGTSYLGSTEYLNSRAYELLRTSTSLGQDYIPAKKHP